MQTRYFARLLSTSTINWRTARLSSELVRVGPQCKHIVLGCASLYVIKTADLLLYPESSKSQWIGENVRRGLQNAVTKKKKHIKTSIVLYIGQIETALIALTTTELTTLWLGDCVHV